MLLMLLSSCASCSCFGRRGGGDAVACVDCVPRSAHILVCLRAPPALVTAGGRTFEVNRLAEAPGFFLGAIVNGAAR